MLALLIAANLASCTVVDGDTLKCIDLNTHRSTRIRLNGIDAPELKYCRPSYTRKCSEATYSSNSLRRLTRGRAVSYEQLDIDRYRRIIARTTVGGKDLSCEQVRKGYATYVRKWDERRKLWHSCSYVRRNYHFSGEKAK